MTDYAEHFVRAAQRTAERWSDGRDVDLVAEMSAMTLDGAGSALFGADLREPAPQITLALSTLLKGFQLAMAPGGRALLRTPLPVGRRVRSAKAELETSSPTSYEGAGGIVPHPHPCSTGWRPSRSPRESRSGPR